MSGVRIRPAQQQRDREPTPLVYEMFWKHKRRYGARRIAAKHDARGQTDVQRRTGENGIVAIPEFCGIHDWFPQLLPKAGGREEVLIQAEKTSSRKTDRREPLQVLAQACRIGHRTISHTPEPGDLFGPHAPLRQFR